MYCLILNYQGSLFCCLKQLNYYIKFIYLCQQFFNCFKSFFSNFITLLEQPRHNIKFLIPCQQLFKFVFKNFLNCPQMTVLLFYSLFLLLSSLFYFFTQPDILRFNRLNYFTFLMTTLYNLLFL